MDGRTHRDLWKEAEDLLRAELGDQEWQLFISQSNPATPQTVFKDMENVRERSKNEYTTHTFMIKDKKIFEFNVGRIMKRFEIICQMFDRGMTCAPESVGVVWTAFRMLTKFFLDDQELCESLTGAVDRMSDAIFLCDIYAYKYLKNTDDTAINILDKIPIMYKTVLKFCFETKKLFPNNDKKHRSTTIRVLRSVFGSAGELRAVMEDAKSQMELLRNMADVKFQSVVEDLVRGINQELMDMSQDVKTIQDLGQLWHAEIMSELKTVSADVAKSKAEMEKKKLLEEFARWLSWLNSGIPLDLLQPRDQQRENMVNKSEGTCRWIFDRKEYQSWVDQSGSRILWLNGPAGFGKSFLTSSVIDSLSSSASCQNADSPILIYFFCKIGNDAKQRGQQIMLHLLLQLFSKFSPDPNIGTPSLSKDLAAMARCIEAVRSRSTTKNYSEKSDALDMTTLASMFIDIAAEIENKILIVLDALDECTDRKECPLLRTLTNFVSTDQNIRLFVSSRPDDDIVQAFNTLPTPHICIKVDRICSEADITKFVDERFSTTSFASISKSDKRKARKAILKKSEGMFQYAAIAVQGLSSIEGISNFPWAVKNLPKGMNSLYSRKLQSLEESNRRYLRAILRWMVCAEGSIKAAPIVDEFGTIAEESTGDVSDEYSMLSSSDDSDYSSDSEESVSSDSTGVDENPDLPSGEMTEGDMDKLRVNTAMEKLMIHVREFVKFDPNTTVLSLQHTSIQDWIVGEARPFHHTITCMECRKREMESCASTFELAPKYGHFLMACTIMRRLNDPKFQQKYLNVPNVDEGVTDFPKDPSQVDVIPAFKNNPSAAREHRVGGLQPATPIVDDGQGIPEEIISHEELYEDDATDDGWATYVEEEGDNEAATEDNRRYEITHWAYHVRKAEMSWTEEERGKEPERQKWHQLYQDIDRFLDPKSKAYKSWLKLAYNVPGVTRYWETPVRIAAKYGLEGTLKRYIDAGADLWEKNEWGNNCLHHICMGGNEFVGLNLVLEEAMKSNPAAVSHVVGHHSETAIMSAASYQGTVEHIRTLLAHGAKPEIPDQYGQTCLHYAVRRRDVNMCSVLLECKEVDVNAKDENGETPLHWLLKARNASIEIAQLLIDHGADVRMEDNDSQAPLFEAASTDNVDIARLLLEHGADVNDGENVFGWTALHAAVNDGSLDFVKLLIEYNADILASDNMGRNPIAQSADNGYEEIFELLLESQKERSPDLSFLLRRDIKGHSPLHRIAAKNRRRMADLLLNTGDAHLLCSQQNIHGATPLHSAAQRGYDELVELLLEKGSDPKSVDRAGDNPLALAARRWIRAEPSLSPQFDRTIAMLIDRASSVDNLAGLLDLAIEEGAEQVCSRLTKHTNTIDKHGWSPLLVAVQEKQESIIKLLSSFDTSDILARLFGKQDAEIGFPPSAWGPRANPSNFVLSPDGLEIYRGKIDHETPHECILANHPIPFGRSYYYFEMELIPDPVQPASGVICIGFSSRHVPLVNEFPGWGGIKRTSWGYHGDDGCVFSALGPQRQYPEEMLYGPTYTIGDTVGAGVDFRNGIVFYTINGKRLGNAETGESVKGRLYPVLGFSVCSVRIRANFGNDPGKPFKYKWES